MGDVFLLGSSSWRIEDITPYRVLVSPAPGAAARTPFWKGDPPGAPGRAEARDRGKLRSIVKDGRAKAAAGLTKDSGGNDGEPHGQRPTLASVAGVRLSFERPNGLAFTPDKRARYIVDAPRRHSRRFDVLDGTPFGGRSSAPATGQLRRCPADDSARLGAAKSTVDASGR